MAILTDKEFNDEICSICHDPLNEKPVHQIPECKHKFHTDCVINWYRYGNSKCPFCNTQFKYRDDTSFVENDDYYYNPQNKYRKIYFYSKQKTADPVIKKEVNKITENNKKINDILKNINTLKNNPQYKKISEKIRSLRSQKWRCKLSNFRKKRKLCQNVQIVPIIITKKIKK